MNTYTIKSVVQESYCLETGDKLYSTTLRTMTNIKDLLIQLGVKFDKHGNAPAYSKVTRLVRQGYSINEALALTFS